MGKEQELHAKALEAAETAAFSAWHTFTQDAADELGMQHAVRAAITAYHGVAGKRPQIEKAAIRLYNYVGTAFGDRYGRAAWSEHSFEVQQQWRDAVRVVLDNTAALAVGYEGMGEWRIKLIAEPDSGEAVNTYHATSPTGKVVTVFAANEAEALEIAKRRPIQGDAI